MILNPATRHLLFQILSLGLSFALSLTVALVYKRLNRGAPQVKTFPQTLAVSGIVAAIIVLSIGDNIARGIGLVGALTVIRFRSNLQDPRDLIFAFAALATGVAAGAQAFVVAVVGTALFLAAAMLVSMPWFARTDSFSAILSFQTAAGATESEEISRVLRSQCREFSLVRGQYRRTHYGEDVTADELLFQLNFSIGAHGAHPF